MSDEFDCEEPVEVRAARISSDRTPTDVERQVCSASARSTLEDLCAMVDAADWLLARARSIHYFSRQIAIGWIERNGEFDIGNQHYSVGYNTTVRCTDPKQCGQQLLEVLGGDFGAYMDVLVAQPYKHGAAKRLLSQAVFRDLFMAKRASRLVAGVPERVLRRTDSRFVR